MILKLFTIALIGIVCGLLGSYAGSAGTLKLWRRAGIPIILTTFACLYLWHLAPLSLVLLFLVLSQGYGIPCYNDSGSLVGRFIYNLLKKYADFLSEFETQKYASILTRGIIGLLVCLVTSSIPIITGHWISYVLCSISIISIYAGLSWRSLGSFTFLKKSLTVSELIIYLAIGVGITTTILF